MKSLTRKLCVTNVGNKWIAVRSLYSEELLKNEHFAKNALMKCGDEIGISLLNKL